MYVLKYDLLNKKYTAIDLCNIILECSYRLIKTLSDLLNNFFIYNLLYLWKFSVIKTIAST